MKQIPNIITLTNLFLGCYALNLIFAENISLACIVVLIAAFLDLFDGFFARLLNAESEIGKQLDTLADLVTFGVVPGFIMFTLLSKSYQADPAAMGDSITQVNFAFLLTLSGAVRLARFNIKESSKDFFEGLPVPAMALFVISLPLIIFTYPSSWIKELALNTYFLYGCIFFLSWLMISSLEMFSFKFSGFGFKKNVFRYLFILISIIMAALFGYLSIAILVALYIIFSLIYNYFQ